MSKKIKVAYLDYSPHFAGAERALCTIISRLDRSRFEPIIIFPFPREHHERYKYLNCKLIYLSDGLKCWMGSDRWQHPVRGTDFLKRTVFGHRLANFLVEEGIKLLHINLLRPDSLMWFYESHIRGVNIIGHFRSLPMSWVPNSCTQKNLDCIINVSNVVKSNISKKYSHPNSIVIYDSADIDSFNCENSLDLNARPKIISSVAALFPNKGHDNAIRAFSLISAKFPEYKLQIIGGGSKEEIFRLGNIAKDYNISEDRIYFSRSQVDSVREIYANSRLILSLTKEGEAFGLVPFEASLCDTPTITPCRGAITELLVDNKSAIMVDTLNVGAISERISWALEHLDVCESICKETKRIVLKTLKPQKMVDAIMETYDKLLNHE